MSRLLGKPEEIQRVIDRLSDDEIEEIKKENPFRNDRNSAIYRLYCRGVKLVIISKISGLSNTSIARIVQQYKGRSPDRAPISV